MYTLIYSSQIETYLGDIDISSLVYAARQSNADHKITGILLFLNDRFIQVLEGEKQDVKKLYDVIRQDRRHKNLKVLLEKDIDKRQFDGWNLGFKYIRDDELDNYPLLKSVVENETTVNDESGLPDEIYNSLIDFKSEPECSEAFY